MSRKNRAQQPPAQETAAPLREYPLSAAALLLVAAVVLLYGRTILFDQLVFDDPLNITRNPYISSGLTMEGVRVALFQGMNEFWFPVTSLSHMLEVSLFGINPHVFHATNVLLHALNSVLVLLVFRALAGGFWPAAIAAALFAIHPLSAEPAAWISGRRDLLCATFWLLTVWAYLRHGRAPSIARMGVVLLCFVLGMASKVNMIALLPIFFLLDWQPLGRLEPSPAGIRRAWPLLLEKIPLFLLGAWLTTLTTKLQAHEFGAATEQVSFTIRLMNAVYIYAFHLVKAVFPLGLSVHYPYLPQGPGASWFAAALLLLIAITALCFWQARRMPLLLVGWCWYGIALFPTAGVFRVTHFLTADRYAYIPALGLYLMAGWALVLWLQAAPGRVRPARIAGGITAAVLALLTFFQAGLWRDEVALWGHAAAFYPGAPHVLNGLGNGLYKAQRLDEARAVFESGIAAGGEEALMFHVNLTDIAIVEGRWADGIAHVREVHKMNPAYAHGYRQLADILEGAEETATDAAQKERLQRERRIALLQERIVSGEDLAPEGNAVNEELAEAYGHLATSHTNADRLPEALRYAHAAARADRVNPHYHHLAAKLLARLHQLPEARKALLAALEINPIYTPVLAELALLESQEATPEGKAALENAMAAKPGDPAIQAMYLTTYGALEGAE